MIGVLKTNVLLLIKFCFVYIVYSLCMQCMHILSVNMVVVVRWRECFAVVLKILLRD